MDAHHRLPRRTNAVLLLGPTGSGKTPLGEELQRRGLDGRRCRHFDFGAQLRRIVSRGKPDSTFTGQDIAFLRRTLETGALLEDGDFPIAQRILSAFLELDDSDHPTWIVMNGLPRHVGQAVALGRSILVQGVIVLDCSAETVRARIAANTGGDRTQRTDDDRESVLTKLAIFQQRTAPLLDHYSQAGSQIARVPVTVAMTPREMWDVACRQLGSLA